MEEESFSIFLHNLKNSLDNNKIDMLNGMSTETYTCAQAERILSTFNLGDLRVDALEILSTKLEDPENKGKIMVAFQNDSANTKTNAYKIINRIKVASNKPNPAPAKKAATRESYIPPDDDDIVNKPNPASAKKAKPIELSGKVNLEKASGCGYLGPKVFHIDDEVRFSFRANKPVETTKLHTWISECESSSDKSCYTPYLKLEKDILPDWDSFAYENAISLKSFLSNLGKVRVPTRNNFFHIAIIIKEKIVAEDTFEVRQMCD
jgi:hypothetical protein